MLFDLQSPGRRRVLKIVYGTLAALFLIGFVGFGVGTNTGGGGILDSITGGGGGGDDNPYEDEINAAQDKLQLNPKDTAALAQLVEFHYRAGTQQIEVDQETGEQTVTSEAEEQLNQGADAWAKYEKLAAGEVQNGTALLAFQTFSILGDASLRRALEDNSQAEALTDSGKATSAYADAAEAQRILAEKQPTTQAYSNLAFFLYRATDIAGGDAASQQAVQLAKGAEATQVEQALKQAKMQGEQLAAAITELQKTRQQGAPSATGGGENPLSGLSDGGLGGASGLSGGALGGQ